MAKLRVDKPAGPARAEGDSAAAAVARVASDGDARSGYLLQCAPGLAKVLQKELNFIGATTRDQKPFVKLQRNHDLLFLNRVKSDERLHELRTAEMVLKCPAYGRFKISQRQLGLMAETLSALGPRRLIVSVAGKVFQRQDLARFLTKAMNERGYSFDDDVEDEVWMFCIDESWYFGLPLFKARMQREERANEREGSLPPTIAAAMAFAAVPKNDDVVLDPTCGSGTVLAEFHAYAPSARLIGRDIDPRAVAIAKRNVPSADISVGDSCQAGRGRDEETSDIKSDGSTNAVSLTLANLPFGVQFGDRASNPDLYRDVLRACLKIGTTDWRGLFLTSDTDAFAQAVRALPLAPPETMFKVKIRGELATCYRVKRP